MNKVFSICSKCVGLLWIALLLNSCTSSPKKPQLFTVAIKDMKFVPDDIIVSKGDTIIWLNQDMVAHDVTEETTKAWTSGPIQAGGSWKMVVTAGANYYCSIHQVMKAKIELE